MKDLEKENLRLRRAISDLTLDKLIGTRRRGETSEPRTAAATHRPGARGAGGMLTDLAATNYTEAEAA